MNEIYWITRLDTICHFLATIATLGFVISVVIGAFAMYNRFEADNYVEGGEHYYSTQCMKICHNLSPNNHGVVIIFRVR